jgi:hypothetical protein
MGEKDLSHLRMGNKVNSWEIISEPFIHQK